MNVYERIVLMSRLQIIIQAGKHPLFLVLCFFLFLCRCLHAEPSINNAKGEFVFRYENSGKIRNIKVYYYAPEKLTKSS